MQEAVDLGVWPGALHRLVMRAARAAGMVEQQANDAIGGALGRC
jgi:hypothetical protein